MRTELKRLYQKVYKGSMKQWHEQGGGGVEKSWVDEDWSKRRDILDEFNRLVDELD